MDTVPNITARDVSLDMDTAPNITAKDVTLDVDAVSSSGREWPALA